MYVPFAAIWEAMALASALSLDAFAASFAYGSKKIKVPGQSVLVISLICSGMTGVSIFAGALLGQYIPSRLTSGISFVILFLLGMAKLLDSLTKSIIRKYNNLSKEIRFSLFNFKFILNLYANPEDADIDGSNVLSTAEAASLAIALSLDGITVGLGAAIGNVNGLAVFICSFVTNALAILLGGSAGNRFAQKRQLDLSWLSGTILLLLAFAKFVL